MPKKLRKLETYIESLQAQVDMLKDAAWSAHEKNSWRYRNSWRYYLSTLPLPLNKDETLSYVEPVLYEAVAKLTPTLLNVFTENEVKAVRFQPAKFLPNAKPIEKVINDTINKVFLRENNGYKVLEDSIREACITGDAFIKYYIQENHDEDDVVLSDWTPLDQMIAMADNWEFDVPSPFLSNGKLPKTGVSQKYKKLEWKVEQEQLPTNGQPLQPGQPPVQQPSPKMYIKGTVKVYRDDKAIKVEQIDFKDVFFDDTRGSEFDKTRYFAHRRLVTVGQAISEGFDKEKLCEASTFNVLGDDPLDKTNVVIDQINSFIGEEGFETSVPDDMERTIALWEHYMYSSIPTGKTALYQVVATDTSIIKVTPVSRIPFVHLQYETVPGSVWGRSLFDICQPFQDELSHFVRVMKQRATFSAMGVWQAKAKNYDRKSLLNFRPGAIIEVADIGDVQPMVLPDLPQSVTAYTQRMRDMADRITAAAADSLVSPENSNNQLAAQTVAMMITQSEMKDKVVAKTMARTGIRPLFQGIYELMREEAYAVTLEDGSSTTADKFPSIYDFIIDVNTANDSAIQTAGLVSVLNTMVQAKQAVGGVISDENLYKMADFMCHNYGIDGADFFTNPADQQVDAATQQAQQVAQAAQQEATLIDLDSKRADLALKAAQVKLTETQIEEAIKMGEANRASMKDKSVVEYQKMESDIALSKAKVVTEQSKVQTQAVAVDAEVTTGRNITGVRV